jgi:hypothetical protein
VTLGTVCTRAGNTDVLSHPVVMTLSRASGPASHIYVAACANKVYIYIILLPPRHCCRPRTDVCFAVPKQLATTERHGCRPLTDGGFGDGSLYNVCVWCRTSCPHPHTPLPSGDPPPRLVRGVSPEPPTNNFRPLR